MRIAVNTRLLLPGKLDGMGWFAYHTLLRITRDHPGVEFIFLFDRKWSDEFVFGPNVTPVALFPQARHPFLYYWWFEHAIPAALKKYKADLFLSPDGYLSLSTTVPQLGVIHDLNFEHYPNDLPLLTRWYYKHYFPKFAKVASRLATVSEFSKTDLITSYHVDPGKIDVVYNGVNECYLPATISEIASTRVKHSEGQPYFLFVGMLHQRKNIANLFRAYEEFRNQSLSGIKLLVVGHKKWWTKEMETVFNSMTHKNDVLFLGRLSIDELVKISGAAMAMMYVSYFEGFGVPIIEAMRCGVPVITSDVTSMPEVSGDAALLVNPFDTTSISDAMLQISSDEKLRATLSAKGIVQSTRFTWDATAQKLWQSILKSV
ncbi:MAG: glycosyltransferase family 4 protein [Bacteroidota bacterium]|nr:glycosyltransferase family 4 protein [Bacteroidota bacterium]